MYGRGQRCGVILTKSSTSGITHQQYHRIILKLQNPLHCLNFPYIHYLNTAHGWSVYCTVTYCTRWQLAWILVQGKQSMFKKHGGAENLIITKDCMQLRGAHDQSSRPCCRRVADECRGCQDNGRSSPSLDCLNRRAESHPGWDPPAPAVGIHCISTATAEAQSNGATPKRFRY